MQLDRDGAQLYPGAAQDHDIAALGLTFEGTGRRGTPGVRLRPGQLQPLLIVSANDIAASILGPKSRPVFAKFLDKAADLNWGLSWHQDRTIAVRARADLPGFTAWTRKSGLDHCEPPFELLAAMLTLRIHIDRAGVDNAPLLIAPGSHRQRFSQSDIAATVARYGSSACLAAPGDVWVYALPILHASESAANPRRRRVLQIAYSADSLPGGLEWLGV